jgi:hypothetical protein
VEHVGGGEDLLPPSPFRLRRQVLLGLGAAVVTPFTGLAWPFALLTGFAVGRMQVDGRRGRRVAVATRVAQVAIVGIGMIAMIVFGLVLGGLVSFLIVALAAESEKQVADASPRQYLLAHAILVGFPALVWLLLFSGSVPG